MKKVLIINYSDVIKKSTRTRS